MSGSVTWNTLAYVQTLVYVANKALSLSLLYLVSSLFVSSRSWSSLLALLEQSPKAVVSLGPRLCQPLSLVVSQQPALSDRVIIILEMMPDDSLHDITAEVCTLC